MFVRWLVFIHVLSARTFFLARGAAAAMVFKVRSETDFARIRAMLDLAVSTFKAYMLSFLIMGLIGLTMPFLIHIWNKAWIWLSIVLILFVVIWMDISHSLSSQQQYSIELTTRVILAANLSLAEVLF